MFDTDWIKLELIGDDDTLQPDVFQLVEAAEILIKDGFKVLPYCTEDLIACRRLLDAGCQALMPWAAPIGTGLGAVHAYALKVLRERLPDTPLIIDAGLGLPSQAVQVMEWGFDGVLLNTAVPAAAIRSIWHALLRLRSSRAVWLMRRNLWRRVRKRAPVRRRWASLSGIRRNIDKH